MLAAYKEGNLAKIMLLCDPLGKSVGNRTSVHEKNCQSSADPLLQHNAPTRLAIKSRQYVIPVRKSDAIHGDGLASCMTVRQRQGDVRICFCRVQK